MYVYELALELGRRSADVIDAAEAAGMSGVTPSTDLDPDQAQLLRRAVEPDLRKAGGPPSERSSGGSHGVFPPSVAPPTVEAGLVVTRERSRVHQWFARRSMGIAICSIVLIAAAVGALIVRSEADKGRACVRQEREACVDDDASAARLDQPDASFGERSGDPALVADLPGFCSAKERYMAVLAGLNLQLVALEQGSAVGDEGKLRDWYRDEASAQAHESVDALVASFGPEGPSTEAFILKAYVLAIDQDVADGSSGVAALAGQWSEKVQPAVAELEASAAAHC